MRPGRSLELSYVEDSFPDMDASSAVYPTIRLDEDTLYLAYHTPGCTDSAVVSFADCTDWSYGGPNDEALAGRNVWGLGLSLYNFHLVLPPPDSSRTEWLATFHDGCFRVVSADFEIVEEEVKGRSPWQALDKILGEGKNTVLDEQSPE